MGIIYPTCKECGYSTSADDEISLDSFGKTSDPCPKCGGVLE